MNQQMAAFSMPIVAGGPAWLTLSFVLIAVGIVAAILILWWGSRLAARRRSAERELEARGEAYYAEPAAEVPEEEAPLPTGLPAETTAAPGTPAHVAPPADEPPAPEPMADVPIAAAAPMEASPASLAEDVAAPPAEPEAPPSPAEPAPAPPHDELTRMKGVGPRLAERLNSIGITRFEQIAALTPEEADALDARLGDFQGRLHRDRWIEQAAFLAKDDVAGFEATFGKL